VELQRELAAAYRRIGDVQGNVRESHLGRTDEALASYGKALELLEGGAGREGLSREAEAERVMIYTRMGAVLADTKDSERGMASYRRAEELAERLVARDPQDGKARRQLAGIYEEAAHVERRLGGWEGARERNAKALGLLQPMLAAAPEDRELQRATAGAHTGMGQAERQLGRLAEAKAQITAALAIVRRLAEADPENLANQRELMLTYSNLGDVLGNPNVRSLGDRAGAAEAFGRMAALALRMHEADRADQRGKADYAIALVRLALVTPEEQAERRVELLRRAVGLQEELARGSQDNWSNRAELLFSYNFLGDAYAAAGKAEEAEKAWRAGLREGERALTAGSTTVETGCAFLYRKLAEAAAKRGDRTTAMAYARRTLAFTDPAGEPGRKRPEGVQRMLTPRGSGAMGMVYALLARGEPEYRAEARRWLEKSLEEWGKVAKPGAVSEATRREIRGLEKALEGLQ
jgi:tetratricopeptide (TPR) repeat protein